MQHISLYGATMKEIRSLLEKKAYLLPMDCNCGAERMMYLVDREGAVYTCWDFAAMDEMRVGRLDMENEKFAFTFELLKWTFRNVAQMPECMKCPYVFACKGGCAAKAYRETGDPTKPHCGEVKDIFCNTVCMLCGEHFYKTGEREMTKSLKEAVSMYTPEERSALLTSRDPKTLLQLLAKTDIINQSHSDDQ